MFLELRLDFGGVAHEEEFGKRRILPESEHRPGNDILGRVIPAHGIERDFHGKKAGEIRNPGWESRGRAGDDYAKIWAGPQVPSIEKRQPPDADIGRPAESGGGESLNGLDREDLAPTVVTAGGACRMALHGAAALGAAIELRRVPAIRGLARAQAHLGHFAFWNSHGRSVVKGYGFLRLS